MKIVLLNIINVSNKYDLNPTILLVNIILIYLKFYTIALLFSIYRRKKLTQKTTKYIIINLVYMILY